MKNIKNLTLNFKLVLIVNLFLTLVFIILGLWMYNYQKAKIKKETEIRMKHEVESLANLVQLSAVTNNNISFSVDDLKTRLSSKIDNIQKIDSAFLTTSEIIDAETENWLKSFNKADSKVNFDNLRKIFLSKTYFDTGYPFLVDKDGIIIIHPDSERKDISKTSFFNSFKTTDKGEGVLTYTWPPDDTGEQTIQYFKYVSSCNCYVAITFPEEEMYIGSLTFMPIIIICLFISLIGFAILIYILSKEFNSMVQKLTKTIIKLAEGHIVKPLNDNTTNELALIAKPLNVLINGLQKASEFSNEIVKNNLIAEYIPLSNNDVLGNSLLEMRSSLVKARTDEKQRIIEDDKQKWSTNGLAKFGDILRKDNDDIEKLSFNILSNLVKYLDANQGGMFILNDEKDDDLYFELKAAFAYDKRKYITKRIELGEGIIGRCALEKQSIYMTELPDNYINISSGLGQANPKHLLTVPLNLNNEIFGAIEIASFKNIEPYQIEFVKKIAESISSTISVVRINVRTARLLWETEKQAKKLEQQEEEMRQNFEELRATQEEAARNEEAALGFVNSVNHTIIRADYNLDGSLQYVNTKLLDIMGYNGTEIDGKHYRIFVKDNDLQKFSLRWKNLINGGKHYEEEVQYKTKNGTIWLLATYTPVRNNEGKVVKILYLAIDISAEKQRSLTFENEINAIDSSVIKVEYNPEGDIIHENTIFLQTLGYNKKDRLGKNIFDLATKAEIGSLKALWSQILNKIPVKRKEKAISKSEKVKWFNCTYTPVLNDKGEVYKIIYTANDITEQQLLEIETQISNDELVAKEQHLSTNMEQLKTTRDEMAKNEIEMSGLIQAIDASIFAVEHDLNGYIIKVNEPYTKALGLNQNEIIGKNDKEFIDFSSKEKLDEYKQFWDEIKFGIVKRKINKIQSANEEIWLSETYTPILDKDKKPYKILKLAIDITKSKQLEIEAQRRNEALQAQEEKLRKNLEELNVTQVNLVKKDFENKKIQKDLAKEKYLLDALLDSIPEYIYFKDKDSKFLRISKSLVSLFQGKETSDLIGKSDFDFHSANHANKAFQEEQEIIGSGVPIIDNIVHETWDDGREQWVSTTKMPLKDQDGNIVGTFGISKNITSLKKLEIDANEQNKELQTQEEELRQNLEELQATQDTLEVKINENQGIQNKLAKEKYLLDALLDSLPDYIYFKDKKSRFIRISNSMVGLFEAKDTDELIGKSDFDFHSAKHARKAFNEEQEIIESGIPVVDEIVKETWDDGRHHWVSTTKMPLVDKEGNVVGTFGISKDVSKIKEMEMKVQEQNADLLSHEEELKQNLEELQAVQEEMKKLKIEDEIKHNKMLKTIDNNQKMLMKVIDHIPGKIYLKDSNGKILLVNSAVAKSHGMSSDELLGLSDYDLFDKEKADFYRKEELDIMQTKSKTFIHTKEVEGAEQILKTTKLPLFISHLNRKGILGIQTDITDIKKLEAETKRKNILLQDKEKTLKLNMTKLTVAYDDLKKLKIEDARRAKETMDNIEVKNNELLLINHNLKWEQIMFQTLMDNIESRVTFKDFNGTYKRINKAKAIKLNVKSHEVVIGKSDFDFFPKEHAEQALKAEQKLILSNEVKIDLDEKLIWSDGSITWGATKRIPLIAEEFDIKGSMTITSNITSRKLAEAELWNKNKIISEIVSKVSVIIYKININGVIVEFNGAQHLAKENKNLIGQSIYDLFPDIADKLKKGIDKELSFIHNENKINFRHKIFENILIDGELVGFALEE